MKKYGPFTINAKAGAPAELLIYGPIGGSWDEESVTAAQFVRDLQNIDASEINLRINSTGGSVFDALAIHNALQRHPATVNVHVDGIALSAASLISMAGDTVSMAENALMMIHAPWTIAMGDANAMRDVADMLDKMSEALAKNYARKSGKKDADMLAMLKDGEDHWYTAEEAVAEGFADNVSAPIEAKAEFDLSQFRRVPAAAAAYAMAKEIHMPEVQTPAAPAPQAAPAPAVQPTTNVVPFARTNEHNAEIHAAFGPFLQRDGVNALLVDVLKDTTVTVEAARAKLLTKLGESNEPANPVAQRVEMGVTEGEKVRAATVEAILYRAGVADDKVRAGIGANPFRGAKLLDLARASLERGGSQGSHVRSDGDRRVSVHAVDLGLHDGPRERHAQVAPGGLCRTAGYVVALLLEGFGDGLPRAPALSLRHDREPRHRAREWRVQEQEHFRRGEGEHHRHDERQHRQRLAADDRERRPERLRRAVGHARPRCEAHRRGGGVHADHDGFRPRPDVFGRLDRAVQRLARQHRRDWRDLGDGVR
jgi:ATP-dependent protease ClpP protease subunit